MSDIPSAYDDAQLDRSSLNIGDNKGSKNKLVVVGLIIAVLLIVAIAIFFFIKNVSGALSPIDDKAPTDNQVITKTVVSQTNDNSNFFAAMKAKKEREKVEAEASERVRQEAENALIPKAPVVVIREPITPISKEIAPVQPRPVVAAQYRDKNAPPSPESRKLDNAVMVSLGSNNQQQAAPDEQDKSYNVPTFANGHASRRATNGLDFLLIHGSSIPCALYTQIISDYDGFVTCRVIQDVYSANGAALLVERGSMVSGRQNVALELGKARIFTTWSDIETPHGISIKIDSLGAGTLGASGSEAWIDNHFKERFGGAILLSLLDDGLEMLKNKATENNSGMTFDNSTENGSDMASKALDSSINIKPTGYSQIGQRINIIVARDIDMSTVYEFQDN